jgi:two-component sensor histidine kinase
MTGIEAITKESYDAYFELGFSPSTGLLATVRRFVTDFYERVLNDAELASRLSLAAHELLENAAAYSVDGHSVMSIGIRRRDGGVEVAIDTRNRALAEQATKLRAQLDELAAAADVAAHYQVLMRRSARQPEGSGLGLGRISAEADMAIRYEIVDDTVHVQARATYTTPAGQ